MSKPTNKLTVRPSADVNIFSGGKFNLGTENIEQKDVVMSRLKICQPVSDAVDQIDGIKNGDFYLTVSNEVIGKEAEFYVIHYVKNYVWFDAEKKLIARADKVAGQWRVSPEDKQELLESDEAYKAESHNYLILLHSELVKSVKSKIELPLPIVLSIRGASVKSAKQLNSKILVNSGRGIPIWGQKIIATTSGIKFPKGTAYIPSFMFGEVVQTIDVANMLDKYAKTCSALQSHAVETVDNKDDDESIPF